MTTDTAQASRRLPQGELIAMLAFLFATVAFSMDAMLPALPEIAAQLTPGDVNRLVKQFSEMQKMMKKMGGMGTKGKRRMPGLAGLTGLPGMK